MRILITYNKKTQKKLKWWKWWNSFKKTTTINSKKKLSINWHYIIFLPPKVKISFHHFFTSKSEDLFASFFYLQKWRSLCIIFLSPKVKISLHHFSTSKMKISWHNFSTSKSEDLFASFFHLQKWGSLCFIFYAEFSLSFTDLVKNFP